MNKESKKGASKKPAPKGKPFKMGTGMPCCFWLNPFAWVLMIIELLLQLLMCFKFCCCKVRSPPVVKMNNGAVRNGGNNGVLKSDAFGCTTPMQLVKRAVKKFGKQKCMVRGCRGGEPRGALEHGVQWGASRGGRA